jgi:asparaginyl-tRNA synthetase
VNGKLPGVIKMYTKIKEIYRDAVAFMGREVVLGGWVRTSRSSGGLGFIELNDGSFFRGVQVVFEGEMDAEKLAVGACITVNGTVVGSPGGKQAFEIKASDIVLEGACAGDYPLQKKRHGFEFLRTIAHLRPRTNSFSAVFRVRSLASFAIHDFFRREGFVYVNTPILTGSDCEGSGDMFRVTTQGRGADAHPSADFFGKDAYITGSGQLAVEPFCWGFRDVYTFGPTFRSENSNTTIHAAEFWMLEPEMAFADLDNYLENAEALLKYVIAYVLENAPEEMAFFEQWIEKGIIAKLEAVRDAEFARITYTDAIELLKKVDRKWEFPVEWGSDLAKEHEKYLCEEHFGKPVFVTDYPRAIKAYYMRVNDCGNTVACADLLVPGVGELIGGSQREEREDMLIEQIERAGHNVEDYDWYLDLRRYGTVKHAGYGLGFERLLMYLTGMGNIRDVLPYPRAVGQLAF